MKYAEGNVAEAEPKARTAGRLGRRAHCVDMAEGPGAALIVAGRRGLGRIKRARMGSVSEGIVLHAHCPVLVMRHH